jgi:two-component system, chemotaxis family, response regulator PixG
MLTPEFSSAAQSQSQSSDFAFVSNINTLKDHLHYCYEEKFTGKLNLKIQAAPLRPWSLYFEKGDLVWGEGGVHPLRRWYRQVLRQYAAKAVVMDETVSLVQPGNYEFLITLLLQKKIQPQEGKEIVTGLLREILFDLHQQWSQCKYSSTLQLKFDYVQLSKYPMPIAISPDQVWRQAMQEWQEWQQAGLEDYFPNYAPAILNAETLQQRVLPSTYQNLVMTMDGSQTLRDLATRSNKDLLTVTKTLLPYLQQGLVKLFEVEDVKPFAYLTASHTPQPLPAAKTWVEPKPEAPLIAYIDDYKVDGQMMERILMQMGYRFIHIQDPMQALPLLLEHKPELIFLDLVMPIINGYEACAQIRRVSRFKDTPIIILTSNDGIVDRVRAKIVGSTSFLAKPIQPAKVQTVLQKYLQQLDPVVNTL